MALWTPHPKMAAADAAFDAVLGGEDYGNLMEYRMVLEEMAYGSEKDSAAKAELLALDTRLRAAEAARNAILYGA